MTEHRHDPTDPDAEPCCADCCDCSTAFADQPDFTDQPHILLDNGKLAIWFDQHTRRIVFLDFEDDTGISLSQSEWREVQNWARELDQALEASMGR